VVVLVLMYVCAFGAKMLREEHIYRPACERVCGKRGLRYEGVEQARKSDRAVSCNCVSPSHDRVSIETQFFSDNAVVEWVVGEATSTMGAVLAPILVLLAGVAVWGRFTRPKR
jgi:hypothetical protein